MLMYQPAPLESPTKQPKVLNIAQHATRHLNASARTKATGATKQESPMAKCTNKAHVDDRLSITEAKQNRQAAVQSREMLRCADRSELKRTVRCCIGQTSDRLDAVGTQCALTLSFCSCFCVKLVILPQRSVLDSSGGDGSLPLHLMCTSQRFVRFESHAITPSESNVSPEPSSWPQIPLITRVSSF